MLSSHWSSMWHSGCWGQQPIWSSLPCVNEKFGVYIVRSKSVKCLLDACKRAFYRAANSNYGKIWRTASEEVVLQLISTKYMPILQYGQEVFSLYNYQLKSLDFVINRFFMKLFRTSNMHAVSDCQEQFNFVLYPVFNSPPRFEKFVNKLHVD